jgi:hypothetical protein
LNQARCGDSKATAETVAALNSLCDLFGEPPEGVWSQRDLDQLGLKLEGPYGRKRFALAATPAKLPPEIEQIQHGDCAEGKTLVVFSRVAVKPGELAVSHGGRLANLEQLFNAFDAEEGLKRRIKDLEGAREIFVSETEVSRLRDQPCALELLTKNTQQAVQIGELQCAVDKLKRENANLRRDAGEREVVSLGILRELMQSADAERASRGLAPVPGFMSRAVEKKMAEVADEIAQGV